jgi:hypothetical protein
VFPHQLPVLLSKERAAVAVAEQVREARQPEAEGPEAVEPAPQERSTPVGAEAVAETLTPHHI